MHGFSPSDLLKIWESGSGKSTVEQALLILSAAFLQVPFVTLSTLDIPQRDLFLLRLRELTFGSQIKGLMACPLCGQQLELDFDVRDLPASTVPMPDPEKMISPSTESSFSVNDYDITFRLPNSTDLESLDPAMDATSKRKRLLGACIISARRGDETLTTKELPIEVLNALIEHIGQTNPLTDLSLPAICPTCGHTWETIFDIVSFFWSEINAWSMRLMQEVHTLAMTYGWREADILAMSDWRRQRYLEMIGA